MSAPDSNGLPGRRSRFQAPVKVAIEKNKLYLLDEDGKEHEADITKKILKDR
jgi:hypothetical protein